ncbi:DUF72 domain-containing protein [Mucilaginibacter arboris]|uniref:DUF72 domain-containing protein n=1 Tax=Mucilaginibacter arboris TaxID=2682090 RepID=A0A7K1T155_9SPHI|nr:DUF72 domain-containing protein [Mucilaginibacter arboris]MVN23312.1 DUF72 domain-containing protein [Mucilaginibacter arboris]
MKLTDNTTFYSGTSGIVLPVPNKTLFPEEFQDKSRLTYYASLFNSVEINSSFYKVPMAATVQKWAESVPANFQFTFKLWKEITHAKKLTFNREDVHHFMEVIGNAGHKKGCLLVQFPPSLKVADRFQLEKLLMVIQETNQGQQWKIALEFRDRSWYKEEIYDLLNAYQMGIVIHDKSSSASPLLGPATNFVYLRFHGPGGSYKGSYTDDFLYEYATYIKGWQDDGKVVYVYFNNTMGDAIQNLMTLNSYYKL